VSRGRPRIPTSRNASESRRGWWGFHSKELITEPNRAEVVTIYDIDATGPRNWARRS